MDYLLWLNFVSNIVLTFSFALFILFVFGRTNSKIYQLPWYKTLLVKIGLSLCACGALLNALTFSKPQYSEVMLNTGLGLMFSWASWFHYKNFVLPYKNNKTKAKKSTRKKSR